MGKRVVEDCVRSSLFAVDVERAKASVRQIREGEGGRRTKGEEE